MKGRRVVLALGGLLVGLAALLAVSGGLLAASGGAVALARAHWKLPQHLTWYWQLQGAPKLKPVAATDIDGFENGAAEVSKLHAAGQHVICYVDVGTWENWRPDAAKFPKAVLGKSNGWPGERWLDVRRLSVLEPLISARFRMCAAKGFDAIEPDNIDGFENDTGFPITASQQLSYDRWVAAEGHALGLAVLQKNDPEQASALQPSFDGVLDEQCNQYAECGSFTPYLKSGKPVLNAEYKTSLYPGFCTADGKLGIMGALYNLALNGQTFRPC